MAGPLAHARRFGLAYLALAAIFGAAIGLFIVLVERPGPKPPPPWSAWKPTSTDSADQTQEIADHVAAQYRLPSGHRLVRVYTGGPGASPSDPIQAVAIATTTNPTSTSQVQSVVDANRSAMYILCGAGAKCAIREGKATTARFGVLRREALELALYTFEYVKGTSSVVTFFPPKLGLSPTYAIVFARADLGTELDHPLRRTLPKAPPKADKLAPSERRIVNELTTRVFKFALRREQSGARVLVLAPAVG